MKGTQREAGEPENVAALEAASRPGDGLQLDLTATDEDDRIPPFGFVVTPLAARANSHRADPKAVRGLVRASREGQGHR
jgi:hypothetical protein